MTIKAAVIGTGSMGQNHARIYADMPDTELIWIQDANADHAQVIGQRYNTRYGSDLTALLEMDTPDVVSVCVPTIFHFEVAQQMLSRGVHTLIEKPIAHTLEEADKLMALAQEKNVHLTVGHIERFNPAISELKQRIQAGEIGEIFRAQARRMSPFPARIQDVGVVVDLSTHDIDILRFIIGSDVVRTYAETARVITQHEDVVDATLSFANGVGATLNTSRLTPTKIRELTVHGTLGMFHVNYLTQELLLYRNGNSRSNWESLKNLTGVDGKKALAVALAIIQAGNTHEVVHL